MAGLASKAKEWKVKRHARQTARLNQKAEEGLPVEAGAKYSLIKEIKKAPYYGKSPNDNDGRARDFITEHTSTSGAGKILPGQLILFDYFEPKTKEDLEYYDASPCTIFFNIINTPEGKRVLGFNIHYYPPRMRYQIMNTIFNIYKPVYSKYFTQNKGSAITGFDYKYIMDSLEKAGLAFGVRMYIPNLISNVRKVQPQLWHIAVYTEGWFKKQTREAVMKHWAQWQKKH